MSGIGGVHSDLQFGEMMDAHFLRDGKILRFLLRKLPTAR